MDEKRSMREFAKRGVRIVDRSSSILECIECGRRWAIMLKEKGRLPRGYWKCPNGCNHEPKL